MQKENTVVDLLGISVNKMMRGVQKNCSIYNISVNPDQGALKKCIDESIEISTEDIPESEAAQRGIIRKKNGTGCYVSIKNVHFFPYLFLEGVIRLIVSDFPPIEIMFFLLEIIKQLGLEISKKELLFYSILYTETKKIVITDENILDRIRFYMDSYGYDELEYDEIYDIINHLLDIEMLSLINGNYIANERFYF